jgi:hypothetical protein
MINDENINNSSSEPANGKKISALRKKISHLRFFIYVLVATCVLVASVSLLWIYSIYTESPFETYYSTPPQQPKALLYLSPKEGNYNVDDEFSVDVLLNTVGSSVVVAAAYLSYNTSKLEVLAVDLSGSIFEFTAEKEINAKDGKIKITLGKPTPGVKVHNGKVATVNFRAKEKTRPYTDNVYFDFTKGSALYSTVIIDDKQGTNILDATRGAKINIE